MNIFFNNSVLWDSSTCTFWLDERSAPIVTVSLSSGALFLVLWCPPPYKLERKKDEPKFNSTRSAEKRVDERMREFLHSPARWLLLTTSLACKLMRNKPKISSSKNSEKNMKWFSTPTHSKICYIFNALN